MFSPSGNKKQFEQFGSGSLIMLVRTYNNTIKWVLFAKGECPSYSRAFSVHFNLNFNFRIGILFKVDE
jgi:hypothetical protein